MGNWKKVKISDQDLAILSRVQGELQNAIDELNSLSIRVEAIKEYNLNQYKALFEKYGIKGDGSWKLEDGYLVEQPKPEQDIGTKQASVADLEVVK